ncbi:MAG: tetratricopeptide repeat protein [bacterium]
MRWPNEEYEERLYEAKKALENQGDQDEWGYYGVGCLFLKSGDWDEALKFLLKAGQINPNNAMVRSTLGDLYALMGRYERAKDSYRRAISSNSNQASREIYESWGYDISQAHFGLGDVHLKLGRVEDAISAIRKGIGINPLSALGHYQLGICLSLKGNLGDAIVALKTALKISPNFARAYGALGLIHLRRGEFREAGEALERCLTLDPDDLDSLYSLGVCYIREGKYDGAEEKFQRILDLAPESEYAKRAQSEIQAIRDGEMRRKLNEMRERMERVENTRCECGGYFKSERQALAEKEDKFYEIHYARCGGCGKGREFGFSVEL